MSVKVRFAPSPTGNIHIGNARPALINWLFARKNGGQFVLRFDDTDVARSKEEYALGISRDLAWLGIAPDQVEKQSERFDVYAEATKKLKEAGVLYACYETPEQLERQRKRLAARGKPPVYDRSGLRVDDEQRKEFEAEGIKPHWRFLLPNFEKDPFEPQRTEISWVDVIRGPQTVDLSSMSDPVLIRADGTWLYTLPSVVDDIEFGISHVIRGDDHVTNTGAQITLFRALGAEPPEFGHHNLLTTETGEGLSKRLGSLSLQQLSEDGYEAMAVASLAVLTGTSGPVDAMENMDALVERFDPQAITKSAAKFDPSELKSLNRRLVHALDYNDVASRLKEMDADGGEEFWVAIRDNLDFVNDARFWFDVVENATSIVDVDDTEFVQTAKSLLPEEPWDHETWGQWVSAVKESTGRKGKSLFMPLRKAVTGLEHGPELDRILPLIGRDRMLARLS